MISDNKEAFALKADVRFKFLTCQHAQLVKLDMEDAHYLNKQKLFE